LSVINALFSGVGRTNEFTGGTTAMETMEREWLELDEGLTPLLPYDTATSGEALRVERL